MGRQPVTSDITVSLDGYVAGPHRTPENPLGERGERLHRWIFEPQVRTSG